MLTEEDFKSEFGKKVWKESFGIYLTPDPDPAPEEKEEQLEGYLDEFIDDDAIIEPSKKEDEDPLIDAFKEAPVVDGQEETIPEEDVFSEQTINDPQDELEDKIEKLDTSSRTIISKQYERGDNIFRELLDYFNCDILAGKKADFVIEEDENCILTTISAAYGLSVLLGGRSRSGKSRIMNKLSKILTSVYPIKSCSNKAFFGASEKINENDFLYIFEYQAAISKNPDVKESIKNITEGQDATNDSNGETQRIKGGLTILTTGADENKKMQGMDVEVSGRFIQLKTKTKKEKDRRIAEYQDGLDTGNINHKNFSEKRFKKLKHHMQTIIYDESSDFEDPFAISFYKDYLPDTQKGVYYRTLYKREVKSLAKIDKPNRTVEEGKIFTNIFDIYLVDEYYRKTYCDNLQELTERSFEALLKNYQDNPSMIEQLKQEYDQEIKEIKKKRNKKIEWQDVWNDAYEHMRKKNPGLVNEWVNLNSTDGKIIVYDPVKKADIYLCDVVDTRLKN